MSNASPKGRRFSPSSGLKTGPLKATLPVASLIRPGSSVNKCKSSSPTTGGFSPDGHRSPGARGLHTKGQSICSSPVHICSIRRTASLDAIYLKRKWPTEAIFLNCGSLQVNKATQTDDNWVDKRPFRPTESSIEDVKLEKYLRHRLRTGKMQGLGLRLISPPMVGDHSITPPNHTPPNEGVGGFWSMNSPGRGAVGPFRPPLRGSLEGLNQEIERLVLKDFEDVTVHCGSIPEGHRAPLLELLRPTRSVNTQTPGSNGDECDMECEASLPPSRGSMSPYYGELLRMGSCESSPDEAARPGTSPHINRFLAREPPDGCEKVFLRVEGNKGAVAPIMPLRPVSLFKPSLGSAFHPLHSESDAHCNGQVSDSEN